MKGSGSVKQTPSGTRDKRSIIYLYLWGLVSLVLVCIGAAITIHFGAIGFALYVCVICTIAAVCSGLEYAD